jgi:hypothetical protein
MEGSLMNRLMLFAVLLLPSTVVFGQSTAALPGSQPVTGKVSTGQWPFDFSDGQTRQAAAGPLFKGSFSQGFDFRDPNATQSAPADLDHLFSAPSADLKSHVELFAHNETPFSRIPLVAVQHFGFEPIPTQWPNAKFEPIPTEWPNVKMLPIDLGSRGLVPARGGPR